MTLHPPDPVREAAERLLDVFYDPEPTQHNDYDEWVPTMYTHRTYDTSAGDNCIRPTVRA